MNGDLKPALKTLLRAYGVGWSVTTAPALVSVIIKALLDKKNKSSAIQKAIFTIIPQLLRKSITKNGFPLLIAASFGGQKFLRHAFNKKKKFCPKKLLYFGLL